MRISSMAMCVAFVLGACGGDDGDGGSADKASDAFAESIRTTCEKAFECMSSYDAAMHGGSTFDDRYGTSVDACITQYNALAEAFLGANFAAKLDASVAAGRVMYDAGDAGVCLAAARALTCDQFFEQNGQMEVTPPECDTTFVGTVTTGGTCTIDFDCASEDDECDSETMTCSSGGPQALPGASTAGAARDLRFLSAFTAGASTP
jgi:hypothetical protein